MLLAMALITSPVAAQELVDYDLVFDQNADRVVTRADASGTETRMLEMPGGVILACSEGVCVGTDLSPEGAVGCVWSLALALRAVAEVCALPEETRAELGTVHARLTSFVGKNAVPPRGAEELDGYYNDQLRQYRDGSNGSAPVACERIVAPGSNVLTMIDSLLSPVAPAAGAGYDLDALLATPRLPVMNPCL